MNKKIRHIFKLVCLSAVLILQAPTAMADSSLFDLNQYKGKVVYLDFWAAWCVPCKKSFPWMIEMQDKYQHMGLQIIAVNVNEDQAATENFLSQFEVNFEIIRDPDAVLAERYSIKGMPTSLLFDTNGKLVSKHTGFNAKKKIKYEAALRHTLTATKYPVDILKEPLIKSN